jgi:uncharacterized protein (DUF433 family)
VNGSIIAIHIPLKYQESITLESGERSGKPCIRGIRITVYDVLSYLASGMTQDEILQDFPYLTATDILACLSYAADREKITLTIAA